MADIHRRFGLVPVSVMPVSGGWLNQKWKIETEQGTFLVKQYSRVRYDDKQLLYMEQALQREIHLSRMGIKCPHYLTDNGAAVLYLQDGTPYSVMEFYYGWNETAGTVTLIQMRDLGRVLGQIHSAFSTVCIDGVKGYPLDDLYQSLWSNYREKVSAFSEQDHVSYQETVKMQEPILQKLEPAFFDALPKGISHEDFAPDNLLFDDDGVVAVVDFDRNQYSYLWHDVGRVLLSFCREEKGFDIKKIKAFLDGYNEYRPMTIDNVVDAFRITWCIEVLWWIQPNCFTMEPCKATEYRDEMMWLTKHWWELDNLNQ